MDYLYKNATKRCKYGIPTRHGKAVKMGARYPIRVEMKDAGYNKINKVVYGSRPTS